MAPYCTVHVWRWGVMDSLLRPNTSNSHIFGPLIFHSLCLMTQLFPLSKSAYVFASGGLKYLVNKNKLYCLRYLKRDLDLWLRGKQWVRRGSHSRGGVSQRGRLVLQLSCLHPQAQSYQHPLSRLNRSAWMWSIIRAGEHSGRQAYCRYDSKSLILFSLCIHGIWE